MAVADGPSAQSAETQQTLHAERQQAPPPPPTQPPPPPAQQRQHLRRTVVRRYDHARDHARLAHICRDVYGGFDDLPDVIGAAAARADTHLLVASTGGAGGELDSLLCCQQRGDGGELDSLLCCQQRGDVLWLYGARTAAERRGAGLAQLLLAEAEDLARRLPGVAALLSVTITANPAMRHVFGNKQGFQVQRRVVAWPAHSAVQEVHQQLTAAAAQQQQQPSFLSALPATAAVVTNAAAEGLLPHWRRCSSVGELQGLLLHLRRADARRREEQPPAEQPAAAAGGQPEGLAATSAAFQWLPGEYELLPAGGPTVEALVQAGQAWLLQPPASAAAAAAASASHGSPAAILLCLGPSSRGVRRAGVVAGSAAALESALLHAAAVADPACCRFYVDCCCCQHEQLWASAGGERTDILPYYKPLA